MLGPLPKQEPMIGSLLLLKTDPAAVTMVTNTDRQRG